MLDWKHFTVELHFIYLGGVEFRVTEESLMECLRTDMHEACLKIDKECR